MAPQNNDEASVPPKTYVPKLEPGEEVVISGMAGRLPMSDNMKELWEHLLNKVDMVTDNIERWNNISLGAPSRFGKINGLERFDQPFFRIGVNQVQCMDPMVRILHEVAYEAIVDAGFNPRHFQSCSVGVFTGISFGESEMMLCFDKTDVSGLVLTGTSRAMYANRISYSLNFTGPSYMLDAGHASGTTALEHGYRAVRDGKCEAAVVAAANLCIAPNLMLQFLRRGVLSTEGVARPFDENGNGLVRSEAISVMFLQKARDAKRIYATVVHAKTAFEGSKLTDMMVPSQEHQFNMLKEFYEECGVDPATVDYVEANANGLKNHDECELEVLEKVFLPGRSAPLPVGSIKSNMGTAEAAAGLCSVTKALLCLESGQLPANINYSTPCRSSRALADGRIKVITETTPFNGSLVAVNSFSLNGCLSHVLLRRHSKAKDSSGQPKDSLPRLLVVSGRTEEAVRSVLEYVQDLPLDVEYISLLNDVHGTDTPGHLYRGYTLLQPNEKVPAEVKYFSGTRRPLWFVFSGMGSQWAGMGRSLLQIPIFADAIEKCNRVLKPKGVDIYNIITTEDASIYDNILNCFVGIAATQIGLVDILHAVGLVPDGIIGHSVGELGCAYADGTFTAEQMVLASYYRGLASVETDFIHGSMAAIGLGYKQIKDMCPPDIEVACHNSHNSSTISGPAESLANFVSELQAKKIFAKEVACANIAYHSRYISKAGPSLLKYLKQVIPEPKARSEKWVSSSVPEAEWDSPEAKLSSAEYHTNNLLKPVLFEETSRLIPPNALTVEIAPHGLLQAILKRSLHKDAVNVALTQRGKDNTRVMLTALGKLYESGVEMDLSKIYPPVEYPVSRGTPMAAPIVKWEHSEEWHIASFKTDEERGSGERAILISVQNEEHKLYTGHVVDGRNLLPPTLPLILAWESLVQLSPQLSTQLFQNVSIGFENVRFHRPIVLPIADEMELIVMVQKGSGNFEVTDSSMTIASGRVFFPEDLSKETLVLQPPVPARGGDTLHLSAKDIYKRFRLRGYNYSGQFCSLVSSDNQGTTVQLGWTKNWVTFLDGLLQAKLLADGSQELQIPSSIQKMIINIPKHNEELCTLSTPVVPVHVHQMINIIQAGGVELRGLRMNPLARRKPPGRPVLEQFRFVPHCGISHCPPLDLQEMLRVCVQVTVENQPTVTSVVKGVELVDSGSGPQMELLAPKLVAVLRDLPHTQANITVLTDVSNPRARKLGLGIVTADHHLSMEHNCHLVVGCNLLGRPDVLRTALEVLVPGGSIIAQEQLGTSVSNVATLGLQVLLDQTVGAQRIVLLGKGAQPADLKVIPVTEKNASWLPALQSALLKASPPQRVVLVAQGEPFNGILGLFNCIRKETGGEVARCFFIQDPEAPRFDPGLALYRTQLDKDLAVNVLRNGQWGSYCHLALAVPSVTVPHFYNASAELGDLNSLTWFEGPLNPASYVGGVPGRELVLVHWSALNFQDVMLASGRLPLHTITAGQNNQEPAQGVEFSGRTTQGRRVMGIAPGGAISNLVDADASLLWDVPEQWTLEEAATIPIAYATALYALVSIGQIKKGESILIHAGSGGVGQAAINVALHYGLTVFTTVGTQEKRDFLKRQFPQLKDSHIGNSRDTSFEQMVVDITDGVGVDLVLNSLTEKKLQASIRCLSNGGRFLEIGMFDLANNSQLGLEMFLKQTTFQSIMLRSFFGADEATKKELHQLLRDAIKQGAVRPLRRTVFTSSEVPQAYRFMSTGQHIGKVLIRIRSDESQRVTVLACPRFHCHPRHCYVIVGSLSGYGLELANWMVLRGARQLVLTSRKGITTGYQSQRITTWRAQGVKVHVSTADVSTAEGVTALLTEAKSIGPVAAIFHIGDAEPNTTTQENLLSMALRRLDSTSRQLCPDLQHFVAFSNIASGRGEARQTSRAMAGSAAERVCEARAQEGLPALAVQQAAIEELQEDATLDDVLQQRLVSSLEALDSFLRQSNPVVSSIVLPKKGRSEISTSIFMENTAKLLGLPDTKVLAAQPEALLPELGLDSLAGETLRLMLRDEAGLFVTPQGIRTLTVHRLHELVDLSLQRITGSAEELEWLRHLLPVIPDEQPSYPALVKLPSADSNGSPVFSLPGLASVASLLEPLALGLSSHTYALQLGNHIPGVSIQELAAFLLPHVTSRLAPGAPFALLGHSVGGLLALELAAALEMEGRQGRVVLLDATPELLCQLCGGSEEGGDKMQVWLLCHLLSLLGLNESRKLSRVRQELNKLRWAERTEQLLEHCPPNTNHSKAYLKAFADATDALIKTAVSYRWEHAQPLAAPVLLVRPTAPTLPGLDDDFLLASCCQQKVVVRSVQGSHATLVESPNVASIINEFLSK